MRIIFLLPLLLIVICASSDIGGRPDIDRVAVAAHFIPLNPADPEQHMLGGLRYLGGVNLRSSHPRFGGISALRWDAGSLAGVTDQGDFIRFEPVETNKRLIGARNFRLTTLRDEKNQPINSKFEGDAEGLELSGHPVRAIISFERHHRIWSYALKDGMVTGTPGSLYQTPEDEVWFASLPANEGVEALAINDNHLSIIIGEHKNADGGFDAIIHHDGLRGDYPVSRRQRASLKFAADFVPTDAVLDGCCQLLVLARRYVPGSPISSQLYEVHLGPASDGGIAVNQSILLATISFPLNVDNMEGLAIRKEGARRFLYIISDDNFNIIQRTLLMKFELFR